MRLEKALKETVVRALKSVLYGSKEGMIRDIPILGVWQSRKMGSRENSPKMSMYKISIRYCIIHQLFF